MSYQNGDKDIEVQVTTQLSSTPPTVETPNRRILYLAGAAMTCILVVAAVMQSSVTSGVSGPIDFAQVLFANDRRETGNNAGKFYYSFLHFLFLLL
jgi:hypothetical protein